MSKPIAQNQIFRIDYSNLFSMRVATMVALVDFDMATVKGDYIIQKSECRILGDEVSHYSVLNVTLPKETDRQVIINTYRHIFVDIIQRDFPTFLVKNGYAQHLDVLTINSISDIM